MASTYSSNLKLELMGTGDQSGTWGDTTNTNLGTLLEQAIVGYTTQAITNGADTVLTISNGASSVARNYVLELTGSLTANRNLIVPAIQKSYIIYNNTTGGFAVTVKVSGQVGVSVPNGKKAIVYNNGTDIIEVVNDPVTLTGTQTLTNKTLTSPVLNTPTINNATMTTPNIGVATATSVNKVAITAPATSATLTIANGKTLTANSSVTLAGVDGKTLTTNNSITLAGVDGKTLTTNNSITLAGTDATVMTFPATSDTVAGISVAQTLTNKRINTRSSSTASAASVTPDISAFDFYAFTALAVPFTFNAPTGTPVDGNKLLFRIKDNGTARALTFNAAYRGIGLTLPTTTVASKVTYIGCVYNAAETVWDVISLSTQG